MKDVNLGQELMNESNGTNKPFFFFFLVNQNQQA